MALVSLFSASACFRHDHSYEYTMSSWLFLSMVLLCAWASMSLLSALRAKDPGFESRLRRDFCGSSYTSDLKTGTPVATLPGAWRCRISDGTGWPGVSILWLGEVESLICNFYLSVAARTIVWAELSLRYTSMLLGRQANNKHAIIAMSTDVPVL